METETRRPVPAPSAALFALENRALFELGAFLASSPFLRLVGRGDRHPVLVLPGFTASDRSTLPLRFALRGQGYWVHGWDLGRNLGPTGRIMRGIHERLHDVYTRHDRKVSLVGWSLGGIYARELARHHPDKVRQVITLGSPFRLVQGDGSNAQALFEALGPLHSPEFASLAVPEADKAPLEVPSTAIYTRTDGVVKWHTCIEAPGSLRESIEVRGSHSGLGHNPAVVYAVLERLAQREGTWRPFRAPPGARYWYPRPAHWRPVAAPGAVPGRRGA